MTFLEQFCNRKEKERKERKSIKMILAHMHFSFHKQLVSGLSPESCYIFKDFGAQYCLMFAQYFDQVSYACEECNNFQDLKSIFLNFGGFSVLTVILRYKEKTQHFFNLQFLLLLSERGPSTFVAQQFVIQGVAACKLVAYKKVYCKTYKKYVLVFVLF